MPLVVEASGRPEALAAALPLLAHEGEALVVSWYGTKEVRLPLGAEFHRRRLRIRSTQVSTIPAALTASWSRDRRRLVVRKLLHALPLTPLATHSYPFEQAGEAFAAVDRGDAGLIHAALCYM
jgi:threonine dehydrogenase-like Zn-dependent dehydrogenase